MRVFELSGAVVLASVDEEGNIHSLDFPFRGRLEESLRRGARSSTTIVLVHVQTHFDVQNF